MRQSVTNREEKKMTYEPRRRWDIPGLVRASEAARQLGLAHSAIYYQIHHGLIRYERVGGYIYILQLTIDHILESKKALESLYTAQQYYDSVAVSARENAARIAQAQKAAALAGLAPDAPEETAERPGS
jgi:hypothetical protein